jgi:hypothetical protein
MKRREGHGAPSANGIAGRKIICSLLYEVALCRKRNGRIVPHSVAIASLVGDSRLREIF